MIKTKLATQLLIEKSSARKPNNDKFSDKQVTLLISTFLELTNKSKSICDTRNLFHPISMIGTNQYTRTTKTKHFKQA